MDGGHYYSVFTSLHVNRFLKPTCYDQYCPSIQIKDKKGKTKLEKRACDKCSLYHSTIKAMLAMEEILKRKRKLVCDDEQSSKDKEDKMWISDDDRNKMRMLTQIGIFSINSFNSLALSKKRKTFLQSLQTYMSCN